MNQLAERHKFYDNGNVKRNKENFQGFLFDSFNQASAPEPISFYRSDFRGAKFLNCYFQKNDFSRADFIDSLIEKTTFDNCVFKYSELYNCYFDSVVFRNTHFKSASFNRLFFKETKLTKGKFQDITIRDCGFSGCKINETEFVQNSLDEVRFDNCDFSNIDFSNMTAINIFFTNCRFLNFTIEADYLGSYFFKGAYFSEIALKYRGRLIRLEMKKEELLGNLFKICLEGKRYYEAINLLIQKNLLKKDHTSIYEFSKSVITELLTEENFLKRSYQIEKIFQLYENYFNTGYIPIDDYFNLIAFAEQIDTSSLSFQDQISFLNSVQRIKNLFQVADLKNEFISSSRNSTMLIEISVSEKNEKEFLSLFEHLILLLTSCDQTSEVYEIIGKRKGSVIFEIAIQSVFGLALLKILKSGLKLVRSISNEAIQIAVDFSVNRKLLLEAKKAKSVEKLQKVKHTQILAERAITNSEKNDTKEVEQLLSIIETAKYFPNALAKGGQ